jgi:hypothetical protein
MKSIWFGVAATLLMGVPAFSQDSNTYQQSNGPGGSITRHTVNQDGHVAVESDIVRKGRNGCKTIVRRNVNNNGQVNQQSASNC